MNKECFGLGIKDVDCINCSVKDECIERSKYAKECIPNNIPSNTDNDKVKEGLKNAIFNDEEYLNAYKNNPLFNTIMNGILESNDDIYNVLANTLYSYNEMFISITNVIAKGMDEGTNEEAIETMQKFMQDNN